MKPEEHYQDFSPSVQEYMRRYGGNPSSLMRVLHRLGIPLPENTENAHEAVAQFIRQEGEEEFKRRMGIVRTASNVPVRHTTPKKVLRFQDKPPRTGPRTSPPAGEHGRPPLPASPPAPPASGSKAPIRPGQPPRTGSPPQPAQYTRGFPTEAEIHRRDNAPQPAQSRAEEAPKREVPPILREFPSSVITSEAIENVQQGKCPFGPPPLIERRSGLDRRTGRDRRNLTELVFRNSRYGGDRRAHSDRRADPPPYRDPSMPVHESIGNRELKQKGWLPKPLRLKNGNGGTKN